MVINFNYELIKLYTKSDSEKAKMIVRFLQGNRDSFVSDHKHVHTFVRFMNFLDSRRKTDWQTVFPKLTDMLRRYNFITG